MKYWKLIWHKISHWEYWPMALVYYPIFPVWLFFAIRARSFFFFNAANPSIKNGGMAMESKKEIYDLIPARYIPKTILVQKHLPFNKILENLHHGSFHFPLIVKPDIGMKAFGVDKIENTQELLSYADKISGDFLIQELIQYPNESGIFYVRHPAEKKGRITGIVSKEFLSVTGNGNLTLLELIKQHPRSHFQLEALKRKYGSLLETVLESDEKFILVPYGSHTRGAKFTDDSHKINEKLEVTIDAICSKIQGFYYGRLDIRHSSFEELSEGKNFRIIEINGAGSEPTHIYDPRHSLFFAWYEIIKHWKMLYKISAFNYRNGHLYLSYKDGTAMLKANKELEAKLRLI